jgi:hypothetical protein
VWKVVETVNNVTTTYVDPPSPFVVRTGNGSSTVNILNTSAGIPINVIENGPATVNVGSGGSVQGIVAAVSIQNPDGEGEGQNTVNVNDSADRTDRFVTMSIDWLSTINWGSITGLAPAAITYDPGIGSLHVTTGLGYDTVVVQGTSVPTYLSSSGSRSSARCFSKYISIASRSSG